MAGIGRWLLPALVVALVVGLATAAAAAAARSRAGASASTAASRSGKGAAPPDVEPPAGPSPVSGAPVDTPFERELQRRLTAASGQADAIDALVDAHAGAPLSGVMPTEKDRWRARERGCWMLENASPDDPRRAALGC